LFTIIKSASESNEFSLPVSVNCPKCEQETVITSSNGIDSLEDDFKVIQLHLGDTKGFNLKLDLSNLNILKNKYLG